MGGANLGSKNSACQWGIGDKNAVAFHLSNNRRKFLNFGKLGIWDNLKKNKGCVLEFFIDFEVLNLGHICALYPHCAAQFLGTFFGFPESGFGWC